MELITVDEQYESFYFMIYMRMSLGMENVEMREHMQKANFEFKNLIYYAYDHQNVFEVKKNKNFILHFEVKNILITSSKLRV